MPDHSAEVWNQGVMLELMIPPHYWLGSTVVVRPSRFGVVLGSIPGLAILFSSYTISNKKSYSPQLPKSGKHIRNVCPYMWRRSYL
jgi:hypothetical protein